MEMAKSQSSRGRTGRSPGKHGDKHADKQAPAAKQAPPARVPVRPARVASATSRPVVFGSTRAILRGEMDKIGLCTLLTILEMERRTGIVVLQRLRQLGRLHVRDGQIIRARIEGQAGRSGAEAIYQMLTWPDGQFELWQAEVEGRDEIHQRTTHLLMEGMRRLDEGHPGSDGAVEPDQALDEALEQMSVQSGQPIAHTEPANESQQQPDFRLAL